MSEYKAYLSFTVTVDQFDEGHEETEESKNARIDNAMKVLSSIVKRVHAR